jgi:hypothetical protein
LPWENNILEKEIFARPFFFGRMVFFIPLPVIPPCSPGISGAALLLIFYWRESLVGIENST